MNTKAVLFDLDGTLLPLDQVIFVKTYFGLLAKRLSAIGYEPSALINSIWAGTEAMVKNDGSKTNEAVFWDKFASIFGEKSRDDIVYFSEFYEKDFDLVSSSTGFSPLAKTVVSMVKSNGVRTILATNPIFPSVATKKRVVWAGLLPSDFELITTYENSRHSKPNLQYYKDILEQISLKPEECIMVGNDVGEDMVASKLGMKVFLLTDHLINKDGDDITKFPHGGFSELIDFLSDAFK